MSDTVFDSPTSSTADLAFHDEDAPRRRMPPKGLSRRGSRRFVRGDSERSLVSDQGLDELGDGSCVPRRRRLPPKTLSRGGSRRLLRSDSDGRPKSHFNTSDGGGNESQDLLLGTQSCSDLSMGMASAGARTVTPSNFLEGLLEEEEEDENAESTGKDEGVDDILSDSLRGTKRARRRRKGESNTEDSGEAS